MKKYLISVLLLTISLTLVLGAAGIRAEVTENDALDAIAQMELDMREISERGSGVFYVHDRLIEARNALQVGGEDNYELVLAKAKEVSDRKDRAFRISDSLRALKLRIKDLGERGLETAKAEENYIKASEAFEKENYDEAEELVFQANKFLTDIEAEQTVLRARYNAARDNTTTYIKEHWKGIFIALVLLLIIGSISYDKLDLIKTGQRLEDTELENKVLKDEMKKAQVDYFNKGLMSRESYEIKMAKYREMLIKNEEIIPVLKARLEKKPMIEKIMKIIKR
ncbi:MAG: hypothetical protein ACE5J5_06110 [Candidatus Hydrothermarchaeales archaeon]